MMTEEQLESLQIIIDQYVTMHINVGNELTLRDIEAIIDKATMFIGSALSKEEHDRLFRATEKRFTVKHPKGQAIFDDYDKVRDWYSNENIADPYFWKRYRMYLNSSSSLAPVSIKLLDETTLPEIMNCLGDPNEQFEGKRLRRGLVIGDVQSGKTATYCGLMCKAIDAGYKVIIILAGITESLRQQTQERIDEGIIGLSVKLDPITKQKKAERVGVGKDNETLRAASFTSYVSDFVGANDNISTSLASHGSAVIFVIKKNVSVLSKLYTWLKNNNYNEQDGYIDCPLLLIDDEADNASINTNKSELNPTKINSKIRSICDLFKNATYTGFTATPFANVFINPKSIDQMKRSDLFPEHFIYVLRTPSTYIGADKIFKDDGKYSRNVRYIVDIKEPVYDSDDFKYKAKNSPDELNVGPFYYRHNKEWDGGLPGSLTDAIYCFFLANIVRDLRGQSNKPRSMLINMSRFVRVQSVIRDHVENIYEDFKNEVEVSFSGKKSDESLPLYRKLKRLWEENYARVSDFDVTRVLLKENILKAIDKIKIVTVNGLKSDSKIDYKANPSLRVIAVGGIALSRGLTLEGLLTSYFYRNTATFDVLMQMGRWFGYRPNYDDIFRIWISEESAIWYREISDSADELKNYVSEMFDQRLTPKDFGIRVRDNCDALQITAGNKMRLSYSLKETFSFYGNLHETPYVSRNIEQNNRNLQQINWIVKVLKERGYVFDSSSTDSSSVIIHDVDKGIISQFMGGISCSKQNPSFNAANIKEFIDDKNTIGVEKWDIAFQGGDSAYEFGIPGLEGLHCADRAIHIENSAVAVSSRRRLLNTSSGRLGLNKDQIDLATKACIEQWENEGGNTARTIPTKAYFEYLPDRKPILIIMLVKPQPKKDDGKEEKEVMIRFRAELGDSAMATFAIGFPGVKTTQKTKRYRVNRTYYEQYMQDEPEEVNDDE